MYFEDGSIITEGMLPGYRLVVNRDYDVTDPWEDGNFDPDVNRAYVNGEVYIVSAQKQEVWVKLSDVDETDDRSYWTTTSKWVDTDDAIGGCYLVEPYEFEGDPNGYTPIDVARFYNFDGVAPEEGDE